MGAIRDELSKALDLAKRQGSKFGLIYLDVDDFKKVNDLEGRIKGDEVLRHVGKVWQQNVREVDIPCRYGGDEFCVILPDCNIDNAHVTSIRCYGKFLRLATVELPGLMTQLQSSSITEDKLLFVVLVESINRYFNS